MRDTLIAAYLDWVNNYLSVEHYAEENGLTLDQAEKFITLAREVINSQHPGA